MKNLRLYLFPKVEGKYKIIIHGPYVYTEYFGYTRVTKGSDFESIEEIIRISNIMCKKIHDIKVMINTLWTMDMHTYNSTYILEDGVNEWWIDRYKPLSRKEFYGIYNS